MSNTIGLIKSSTSFWSGIFRKTYGASFVFETVIIKDCSIGCAIILSVNSNVTLCVPTSTLSGDPLNVAVPFKLSTKFNHAGIIDWLMVRIAFASISLVTILYV